MHGKTWGEAGSEMNVRGASDLAAGLRPPGKSTARAVPGACLCVWVGVVAVAACVVCCVARHATKQRSRNSLRPVPGALQMEWGTRWGVWRRGG